VFSTKPEKLGSDGVQVKDDDLGFRLVRRLVPAQMLSEVKP
jgi:hypothetical protein